MVLRQSEPRGDSLVGGRHGSGEIRPDVHRRVVVVERTPVPEVIVASAHPENRFESGGQVPWHDRTDVVFDGAARNRQQRPDIGVIHLPLLQVPSTARVFVREVDGVRAARVERDAAGVVVLRVADGCVRDGAAGVSQEDAVFPLPAIEPSPMVLVVISRRERRERDHRPSRLIEGDIPYPGVVAGRVGIGGPVEDRIGFRRAEWAFRKGLDLAPVRVKEGEIPKGVSRNRGVVDVVLNMVGMSVCERQPDPVGPAGSVLDVRTLPRV